MDTHYLIYAIINGINGKVYVGAHSCPTKDCLKSDGSCAYMGSGKGLRASIRKHGIENFSRHILVEMESEDDLYILESQLVDEEFIRRSDTYNMCVGGRVGTIRTPDLHREMISRSHNWVRSDEYRQRMRLSALQRFSDPKERQKIGDAIRGRVVSPETREKHRQAQLGKKYSEVSRAKMSLSKLGVFDGKNNPNYRHGRYVKSPLAV